MKALVLRIVLALILAFSAGAATAEQDFTTPIVARLQEEGFVVTQVKRTWLGRILIVSQNGEYLREVVINPHTGEVLRDKLFALPSAVPNGEQMPDMPGNPDTSGGMSGGSGGMGNDIGGSGGGSNTHSGGMGGGMGGGGMGGGN